jgi:uncharacterized membrane protein YcaP (DUF421 family)
MRRELLTHHELAAALRAAGCTDIQHVHAATLENNGQITVSLMPSRSWRSARERRSWRAHTRPCSAPVVSRRTPRPPSPGCTSRRPS